MSTTGSPNYLAADRTSGSSGEVTFQQNLGVFWAQQDKGTLERRIDLLHTNHMY